MARPIGSPSLIDPKSHHHVQMIRQQRLDHARGAGGVVSSVAVDQHVDICIDVGEHAADHMALALPTLSSHLRTGLARLRDGAVR